MDIAKFYTYAVLGLKVVCVDRTRVWEMRGQLWLVDAREDPMPDDLVKDFRAASKVWGDAWTRRLPVLDARLCAWCCAHIQRYEEFLDVL